MDFAFNEILKFISAPSELTDVKVLAARGPGGVYHSRPSCQNRPAGLSPSEDDFKYSEFSSMKLIDIDGPLCRCARDTLYDVSSEINKLLGAVVIIEAGMKHVAGTLTQGPRTEEFIKTLISDYEHLMHRNTSRLVTASFFNEGLENILNEASRATHQAIVRGDYDWFFGPDAFDGPDALSILIEDNVPLDPAADLFVLRFATAKRDLFLAPQKLTLKIFTSPEIRQYAEMTEGLLMSHIEAPGNRAALEAMVTLWDTDPDGLYHSLSAVKEAALAL